MSLVGRLSTAATEKQDAWMFYGPCGIGKTSLAAAFPKVAFITDGFDDGINDLRRHGLIPDGVQVLKHTDGSDRTLQSYEDLISVTKQIAEEPGLEKHIEWVCFDNLSGVQEHIWSNRVRTVGKYNNSRDKFLEYGNGPEAAQQDVREWTQLLDAVCRRGIGVILLAHSTIKKDKNPIGDSFDKIVPLIHEKTYEAIRQWCPNIGYIGQEVEIHKEGMQQKAATTDFRTIRLTPIPAVDAKNRHSIAESVMMGSSGQEAFRNLKAAKLAAKKKG